MSSFYGGKQGRTYHLVQHYDTIKIKNGDYPAFDASKKHLVNSKVKYNDKYYIFLEEVQASQETQELDLSKVREVKAMVDCFSQGGSYTEVNYGQYVIIDTSSKEDPENGCIYRRGFNYKEQPTDSIQNPGAGAIYIGKISGPTGKTPDIAATATVSTAASAISISHEAPSTDGAGNITTANLKFTFPAYSLSTASTVTTVASGERPVVSVEPNSANPFAPIATIKVPIGQNGNSITSVYFDNDNYTLKSNGVEYTSDNTSSAFQGREIGKIKYPSRVRIANSSGTYSNNSSYVAGDVLLDFSYGDPQRIGHLKSISTVISKDSNIEIHYDDNTTASVIPIGSQFHVQGIYNSLNDLKIAHGNGFTDDEHKGWIAVVDDGQDKKFYAYDIVPTF